jgi:excinuclease UvrABC nuclease subunit
MPEEKSKTVKLDSESIKKLPNNKPVVYKILNQKGENIYTGIAKRNNIQKRITDHLPSGQDSIPGGVKVNIQQKKTIAEAKKSEKIIIARSNPKYNKQGKS